MNTQLKNILVPTDFSEIAANAVSTAAAMCRRHKATLHLLHVVDNRYLMMPPGVRNSAAYIVPDPEATATELMKDMREKLRDEEGLNVITQVKSGIPSDEIAKKAQELHCELIVMGTHGASGLREFFIGSNTYAVIRHSTIPVLTIPGGFNIRSFKKILFPIRLSGGMVEKYDFIFPIIEKNDAELMIAGLSKPGEQNSLDPLNAEVRELGTLLRRHKVKFNSGHFVCDNFAKKVLEISEEKAADLVVIDASLDYNWQQFFTGPYTQQVVHHSKRPILSFRNAHGAA